MSWFKRKRGFVEEADALAEDVEAEFDSIAEAFNGFARAGTVSATKDTTFFGVMNPSLGDITGASGTLTLDRPSLVLVQTNFSVAMEVGTVTPGVFHGRLNVDGADQAKVSKIELPVETERHGVFLTRSYVLHLGAGAHALKLRGYATGNTAPTVIGANTDFTYLVIPDPEP